MTSDENDPGQVLNVLGRFGQRMMGAASLANDHDPELMAVSFGAVMVCLAKATYEDEALRDELFGAAERFYQEYEGVPPFGESAALVAADYRAEWDRARPEVKFTGYEASDNG